MKYWICLLLLLVSCSQDIVGFATNYQTTCDNEDKFIIPASSCVERAGEFFCPEEIYVQRCANVNNPEQVDLASLYCVNGFCGKSILELNFNDDLRQLLDSSGANNDGVCTSCPIQQPSGRVHTGLQLNQERWFDVPTIRIPPQFTLLFWIKPSSSIEDGVIFTNSNDGSDGLTIALNGPSAVELPGGAGAIRVSMPEH